MNCQDTVFSSNFSLNCKGKLLDISTPVVMGILNITDDSFYDGGKFKNLDKALKQTEKMLSEGAAIIDVGAASSRPGAEKIPEKTELERVNSYFEKASREFPKAIFSVDTFRAKVVSEALELGASIVNDISGGLWDEDLWKAVAKKKAPYILMHIQGDPQNMQNNPTYENVVMDIGMYFSKKLSALKNAGVIDIIIDPGFGFGKTIQDNYTLLNRLSHFKMFHRPILVGLSRKSMIYKVLRSDPKDSLGGTSMLHIVALENGANILRAHDVAEAKQCIEMYLDKKEEKQA